MFLIGVTFTLTFQGPIVIDQGCLGFRKEEPMVTLPLTPQDYVDNLRGCAPSEEEAWRVGSTIAKIAAFHGIQDAACKRRQQTQRPGAWAGVVCGSKPLRPYVSVTQEKWEKTKQQIHRLKLEIMQSQENGSGLVLYKVLEQVAGFLNHVASAFPTIKLYLNRVYAT
ncbi:hypothetical protein ACA910_008889 [Epithemia clementina (nom. ined.)]